MSHKAKRPKPIRGNDRTKKWSSAELNNETFWFYYNWFLNIALNRFKWENIPDTVDARFLELKLLTTGSTLFFKDEDFGFVALPVMLDGGYSIYDVPVHRTAYANNGGMWERTYKDSVIIYENYSHTIPLAGIEMYCTRISNIERSMDVNINNLKTPILIKTTENQVLTMQNLFLKYDGNVPIIFGDNQLNMEGTECINLGVPVVFPQLDSQRKEYINFCLNLLGIETTSSEKKERMVTEEAMGNLGVVKVNRFISQNARNQACEEINRMFGLNVSCRFNEEMAVIDLDTLFQLPTQGQHNDQLDSKGKESGGNE